MFYTSQDRALQLRGDGWIAKARHALRVHSSVPAESYLGVFAMVGILGGVTAAFIYLALLPGP
jgi:hypothetical protein